MLIEEDNTYDDWFLPAPKQIEYLYDNREIIDYLPSDVFWTSYSYTVNVGSFTIVSAILLFSDGSIHETLRNSMRLVRPIRAF